MPYAVKGQVSLNRSGDFKHGRPVIIGHDLPGAVTRTGVVSLAATQLALLGNIGHPLICQADYVQVSCPLANTDYDFAAYRFPIPKYLNETSSSGRRYLLIRVTGKCTSQMTTWLVKARTSSTGPTSAGAVGGFAAVTTETILLPLPEGPLDEYVILSVRGSAGTDTLFRLWNIAAWVVPIGDDTTINEASSLDGGEIYNQDKAHPVDDTVEVATDAPFTVATVRNLIQTNEDMFHYNVRAVVTWCAIKNYGTLWTASTYGSSTGTINGTAAESVTETVRRNHWEWIYFPRPGVTHLKVYMDGYNADASPANDASVRLGFTGYEMTTGLMEILTTDGDYFSSATWKGVYMIPIPSRSGPLFLDLRVLNGATADTDEIRVAAISVYEVNQE